MWLLDENPTVLWGTFLKINETQLRIAVNIFPSMKNREN